MAAQPVTEDFYAVLGVSTDASTKDIVKSYRAKALQYHPDKNPGDARAANMFMRITRAKDVLTDEKARQAFDALIRARLEKKRREDSLSVDRKRLADSLEERERAAKRARTGEYDEEDTARRRLEAEIERLRREGALRDEAEKRRNAAAAAQSVIRAKWKTGDWNDGTLRHLFGRWGDVVGVVVSLKSGSALVSFALRSSAELAMKQCSEPSLSLEWVMEQSVDEKQAEASLSRGPDTRDHDDLEAKILARVQQAAKLQQQRKAATSNTSDPLATNSPNPQ